MKTFKLALFLISLTSFCFGQTELNPDSSHPKNGVGVNLLGGGALGSIHYNRVFSIKPHLVVSAELGLGYNEGYCLFGCASRQQYAVVPLKATANLGGGKHYAELGIGTSVLFGNHDQPIVFYPILGYRLLPLNKNRIGFRFNLELPLGSNLQNSGAIFHLGGKMPFPFFGVTISYWL